MLTLRDGGEADNMPLLSSRQLLQTYDPSIPQHPDTPSAVSLRVSAASPSAAAAPGEVEQVGYLHSGAQDDKPCSPLQDQNEGHPDADTCRLTVKVNVRDHFHRRRGVCHNSRRNNHIR
jgi:hypothetical protein